MDVSDTDDISNKGYDKYHVGKVINIADGQAHIQNYVTANSNVNTTKWQPMYQLNSGAYTTTKSRKGVVSKRVVVIVDENDTDYV